LFEWVSERASECVCVYQIVCSFSLYSISFNKFIRLEYGLNDRDDDYDCTKYTILLKNKDIYKYV
jgi:hypothetical protein